MDWPLLPCSNPVRANIDVTPQSPRASAASFLSPTAAAGCPRRRPRRHPRQRPFPPPKRPPLLQRPRLGLPRRFRRRGLAPARRGLRRARGRASLLQAAPRPARRTARAAELPAFGRPRAPARAPGVREEHGKLRNGGPRQPKNEGPRETGRGQRERERDSVLLQITTTRKKK